MFFLYIMESFLMNKIINQYPGVSPLLDNNKRVPNAPFCFDDEEEDELTYNHILSPQYKSEEPNNINLEVLENQEKTDKEEDSLSLSITNKISGIMHSKIFGDSVSLEIKDLIDDCQKEEKPEKSSKVTDLTTDKDKIVKIETKTEKKIFGVKTRNDVVMLPRIDYAIKNFKVTLVKYIKELGNKLIKECKFKNHLKKLKLFSPSNKYFTGISNEKENSIFLNFTVGQIFSYPNDEFGKDNRLQRNNKKIIEQITDYIKSSKEIPKTYQRLINFFEMTFEEAIILFYKSEQFQDYKKTDKAKYLDNQFIKVKGFSLFEPNSFIKMLRHDFRSTK